MKHVLPSIWSGDPPDRTVQPNEQDVKIADRFFKSSIDSTMYVHQELGPGVLAFNERNEFGLITDHQNAEGVWLGIQLINSPGAIWAARKPRPVGKLDVRPEPRDRDENVKAQQVAITIAGSGTFWWYPGLES